MGIGGQLQPLRRLQLRGKVHPAAAAAAASKEAAAGVDEILLSARALLYPVPPACLRVAAVSLPAFAHMQCVC